MISWIWLGVVAVIFVTAIILVIFWLRYFHIYPIRSTLKSVLGFAGVALSGVFVTGAKISGKLTFDLSPATKVEDLQIQFLDPDPIAVGLIVLGLLLLGTICVFKLPPEPL